MRFVIFGAGAIGGSVGASLHLAGFDVVLIARGAHYEAIRDRGLTFERPDATDVLSIAVVNAPERLSWTGEEVVLLATKSQDTANALGALRECALPGTAVVCVQNAVENERVALRLFENVYAAVVMVPAAHLEPGIVQAYGTELTGIIDVGRYPSGVDERAAEVSHALGASRFSSRARPDVMRFKYAKLVLNLGNAVDAMCEPGSPAKEVTRLAQEEGRAALRAAEIDFVAEQVDDVRARWARMGVRDIGGRKRAGSSTRQSLARGAPALETDYLNGEITLVGRLHGIPTPVNAALCRLADRHVRERRAPGTLPAEEVLALAGAADYVDGSVRR